MLKAKVRADTFYFQGLVMAVMVAVLNLAVGIAGFFRILLEMTI